MWKCLKHYKTLNMRNHRTWQSFEEFPPASILLWRLLWRQRNASKIQNEKLNCFYFRLAELNKAPWIKHFEYVTLSFACLPKGTFVFLCEQKWIWSLNIFFKKRAIKTHFLFQGNRHRDFSVQGNSYFLFACLLSCSDYGKLMYDLWMTLFSLKC